MLRLALVLAVLSGCTSTLTLRGSSSDFLKRKATTLALDNPAPQITATLNQLFHERGFRPAGITPGENGTQVYFYKGPRPMPPDMVAAGIQLGSWFAAKVVTVAGTTSVTVLGKPIVGTFELCSKHDELLKEIKYTCNDTQVPTTWAGVNMVTGRDETEVVSWVMNGLYERLKH